MGKRIKVLIADDHAMVREGLRSMLRSSEFEVIGEASSGREALVLAAKDPPDVVLMDVSMPEQDGLAALAALKRQMPAIPVLMLSTYESPSYIVRAVGLGAAGYVLKGVKREELLEALRKVVVGEVLAQDELLQAALRQLAPEGDGLELKDRPERLTQREVQILALLSEGLSNPQIGEVLQLSESTVRTHVRNVLQKLGVGDRTRAAVWAVSEGVVD